MREVFRVYRGDIRDVMDKIEDEEATRYVFVDEIIETVREGLIPELCYLTSDNTTIYSSFLIDHACLEEFERVSLQCCGFKCDLALYFL